MCCSVMQRVAACCSVLQRVAAYCSVLQRSECFCKGPKHVILDSFLRSYCVAVRYIVLQQVAACCSVLQRYAACCSVMQRVAACCKVLQRVAAYLMLLQRGMTCLPLFLGRRWKNSSPVVCKKNKLNVTNSRRYYNFVCSTGS